MWPSLLWNAASYCRIHVERPRRVLEWSLCLSAFLRYFNFTVALLTIQSMWEYHWRLCWKVVPKYLYSLTLRKGLLLRVKQRGVFLLVIHTKTVFSMLSIIYQFKHQSENTRRDLISLILSPVLQISEYRTQLSVNSLMLTSTLWTRSLMKSKRSIDAKTEPRGTPEYTFLEMTGSRLSEHIVSYQSHKLWYHCEGARS